MRIPLLLHRGHAEGRFSEPFLMAVSTFRFPDIFFRFAEFWEYRRTLALALSGLVVPTDFSTSLMPLTLRYPPDSGWPASSRTRRIRCATLERLRFSPRAWASS